MILPKNPTVQLSTEKFTVARRMDVSSRVGLFYMEPCRDEEIIYREAKNLRHIGQYFKVSGFGFTRLYSCVISLTDENRLKNIEILNKLSIKPLVYRGAN